MERDRLGHQQLDASHVDKTSEQQEVIPLVLVYPQQHGIEIERTDAKIPVPPYGFEYENICFQALLKQEKELFLLGPRFVNFIFEREDVGDLIRPDIIGLKKKSEDDWVLKALYEIKLGPNHVTRKLNGFSQLLKELRKRELYFSNYVSLFLSEVTRGQMSSPSHITIPKD